MSGIREYIESALRGNDPILYDVAHKFWETVKNKARDHEYENWIRAVMYKCTGRMDIKEAYLEWKKEESFLEFLNEFATAILMQDKLEEGIGWQKVVTSETESEQKKALRSFLRYEINKFRNSCIDYWRTTEGTFSYYYRRIQRQLRKNLNETNWSLYFQSRYYGPSGLEDPPRLDINDQNILNSIQIPKAMVSNAKRITFKEPLLKHAKWFHENIDESQKTSVAIRTLVKWLCDHYDLLTQKVSDLNDEIVGEPSNFYSKDMQHLAKKALSLLNEKEIKIILMRWKGNNYEKIAQELGLSGPSHVSYYINKAAKVINYIKQESPALSGAIDEESELNYPDADKLEQIFTEYFIKMCHE